MYWKHDLRDRTFHIAQMFFLILFGPAKVLESAFPQFGKPLDISPQTASSLSLSNHFVTQIIHMLKFCERTSLVIQWLEVCLAMQRKKCRAPVQSVAWEDPTCCGAVRPMHQNS